MDIKKGYIYILKDEFYEKYDQEKVLLDNKKGNRPHYYCFKKDEINWVIPLSSEFDKYKKIMEKDIAKRGSCNKFVFAEIGYKKEPAVLLIQNIFPVRDKDFLRVYEINKFPCKIENEKTLKEINNKATQILKILEHKKYFLTSQIKVIEIKEEMKKELNEIKEKNKIDIEVQSKKIEFSNEITGKTIYVEMRENENGKKEIRASQNSEPFNQTDNYIKYESIIEAAAELINKGFKAVKEIKIEEKKLNQEFNEMLQKKTKEIENMKIIKNNELEREK